MAAASSSAPRSLSTALLRHPLASPTSRPPSDDLDKSWVLEFVLRQPIPDSLAHEIFLTLPFSSPELHPHLRKTILLRRLSSDVSRRSISERTLLSIELIEELNRASGTPPSKRMKSAYCAAAVECTALAYRRDAGEFKDAVKRIWMARIFDLMQSEAAAGLVSEPLIQWWKKMRHCFSSGDGCAEILEKGIENTLRLVKDYVDEAMEEMGPSFLEIAAAEFVHNQISLDAGEDEAGKGVNGVNGCFGKLVEKDKTLEDCGVDVNDGELPVVSVGVLQEGNVLVRPGGSADTSRRDLEDDRAREESVCLDDASAKMGKAHHFVVGSSQDFMEVEVENNRTFENVIQHEKINHTEHRSHIIEPGEVNKTREALKKSCFDLNMVVEDPLPEAQVVAATVLASMSHDHVLQNENTRQSSTGIAVLPVPTSADFRTGSLEDAGFKVNGKSSDLEGDHVVKECNKDAGPSKSLRTESYGTFFERNPTAHTCEWSDDSVDTFEKSPNPKDSLQSPYPMTRRICLPQQNKRKVVKRRVIKRWTSLEEDKLKEAVSKYGRGNWKLILNNYSEIFEERTEVDLKDKWRNITRHLS